jgi:hypothetical protein
VKRGTALGWAAIAVASLAGVLLAWLGNRSAGGGGTGGDRALFGPTGSVLVLVAALLLTGVGAAGAAGRARLALRRLVVLAVAVAAGGVAAMAFGGLFAPQDTGDVGTGLLLLLGAAAMIRLAVQLSRPPPA